MKITRYDKQIEMTLDETWIECLRMWYDCCYHKDYKHLDICEAKRKWLTDNGYIPVEIKGHCFFCSSAGDENCIYKCPGILVDPDFRCWHDDYDRETNRIAFYSKLVGLNAIRLGQQLGQRQHICLARPIRRLKIALQYLVPRRLTLKQNPRVHAWLWWNL